jgi:hypothetical protein
VERLGIKVIMRASKLTRFERQNWWRTRETLRDGVLEWQKLLYYRLVELRRLAPVTPVS